MPIYAYRCRDCSQEFETLVMPGETPLCQACDSEDLVQQLSLIASAAKGGDSQSAPAACDATGGCACPPCDSLSPTRDAEILLISPRRKALDPRVSHERRNGG